MARFSEKLERVRTAAGSMADAFFGVPKDWIGIQTSRCLMIVLFLTGLWVWCSILNWGNIPLDRADWYDITAPRSGLMQLAFQQGQLPLQASSSSWSGGVADRYLAIGDLILSPQVILLKALTIGQFALVQVLLMGSLGFWGLVRLKRRYRLSLAAFLPLFWLFFFNGHVVDHLVIGHLTWAGAFLIPFIVALVLELYDRAGRVNPWKWGACFALVQGAIILQGALHTYTLILILLGVIWLFQLRWWKPIGAAFLFSVLLAMVRILPVSLMAGALQINFGSGFTTLNELFQGLVDLKPVGQALISLTPVTPQVAWWEFDYFVGWIGLGWLLVFGLGIRLRQWPKLGELKRLLGVLGLIALLSVGRLYNFVFLLQIPLLNGERITSRFFILPLIFLAVLASIGFQRWLEQRPASVSVRWLTLAGLLLLVSDLRQHYETWKITELAGIFPLEPLARTFTLTPHPDPVYFNYLIIGGGISLATLIGLLALLLTRSKFSA